MTLDFSAIKDITCGAAYVDTDGECVCFHRFTAEQEELYKARNADFYKKTFATSGVKLCFETDSESLFLKVAVESGSSRTYYAADLFVNGVFFDSLNNYEGFDFPADYTCVRLPVEDGEKRFTLGKGVKKLCLYLPWSVNMRIKELSLDDGAYVKPIKQDKRLIAFGDSITHGYDALHPSNKYVTRVAEYLGADEHNKAIGAEVFCPDLARTKDGFEPDYVTVAYGTNDWSKCGGEELEQNCKDFLTEIRNTYPKAEIIVLSPIWRKDLNAKKSYGAFENVEKYMRGVVEGLKGVRLISGIDFVPHNEKLYSDLCLHPNDEGFIHYAENLIAALGDK